MPRRAQIPLSLNRPTLSIVVPVYNEAETVTPFYNRLHSVLQALHRAYEIIYVNDGSADNTVSILLEQARRDPNVKILDLSRNFGKEIALSAGIDSASGDAVIPIDADLQDPPELIGDLINKWQEGYDVVYATRITREGETFFKKGTAILFYRLIAKLTPIKIPENAGDFRLLSRPAVDALKELRERHRFMKGLFSWIGFKQGSVAFKRESRTAGRTKWNYWKLWNFALEGITSFSHLPLQLASYAGFLISVLSFLYGVFLIGLTLVKGNLVPGYPSLMVVVLFLGGVQLMTLGVIGEYIGRIYDESKQRPLYIVRQKFGFPHEG